MLQLCFAGMHCNCQIESQIKSLHSSARGLRSAPKGMKWIRGLLIAAFTKDRFALWSTTERNISLSQLNLKWIQIMFFAATRRLLCSSRLLAWCVRWWGLASERERKLKFQIVYNYFSINCHTLHTEQLAIFSLLLLLFWVMEKIFFSTPISVFGFLLFLCFACCALFSEWGKI